MTRSDDHPYTICDQAFNENSHLGLQCMVRDLEQLVWSAISAATPVTGYWELGTASSEPP